MRWRTLVGVRPPRARRYRTEITREHDMSSGKSSKKADAPLPTRDRPGRTPQDRPLRQAVLTAAAASASGTLVALLLQALAHHPWWRGIRTDPVRRGARRHLAAAAGADRTTPVSRRMNPAQNCHC